MVNKMNDAYLVNITILSTHKSQQAEQTKINKSKKLVIRLKRIL